MPVLPQNEAIFEDIFTNIVMIILYGFLLISYLVRVLKFRSNRQNIRLPVHLLLTVLSVFVWICSLLARYCFSSVRFVYIITFIPYITWSLSMISLLFFVIKFYDLSVFASKSIFFSCMVIPVTTIFAIYSGYMDYSHNSGANLIRLNPSVSTRPLNHVFSQTGQFGVWHYFVVIFTDLIAVVALVIITSKHRNLPKIYREPSKQLIYANAFIILGQFTAHLNIIFGSRFAEIIPFDFNMLGFFIAVRYLYLSTLGNQGLVFLSQARNDIINHLEQSILILDGDRQITYTNTRAEQWLVSLDITDRSYSNLIERLTESATQCEKQSDNESGCDFYFDNGGSTKTYNLREKGIYDNKNRQIGTYVIYSDVTENRALIQRLEVGAGRDALTGLHNRGMMEYLKTEMDKPESLPLAVIVCDLNDLKKTNDTYGHQQGDVMLRVAGEALSTHCPPVAQAGRIGGDEFLILLPQTTKKEADELIVSLNEHLKTINDYPYKITLAMGAGVKEKEEQSINDVIVAADEAMYENKKAIKGSSRDRVGAAAAIA